MSTEIKNYFAFHPLNGCVYHQKNRVLIINAKNKMFKDLKKMFSDCPLLTRVLENDFQTIMPISCLNFSYSLKSLTDDLCQFGKNYGYQ